VVRPDGVPAEVWKILEDLSIGWLKDFFNEVLVERSQKIGERVLLYQYLRTKKTYKNMGTIEE